MPAATLLIGLGQIGMGYDLDLDSREHVYTHARALTQNPAFNLVGAVDPDGAARHRFTERYTRPAYAAISEVPAADLDIVVVAAPTNAHAHALRATLARWRPKVVLCEKPLSYDLAEATEMVRLCAERGVRLFVNYMRRSDPAVIEIKRRIMAGEIASPLKALVWYSKGLMHNGSHFVNLLEYWLGEAGTSVAFDAGRTRADGDREPDFRLAFERGSATFLAAWEEAFSHYTVELLSPSGRLRYDRGGRVVSWESPRRDETFTSLTTLGTPETIPNGMQRSQACVAEALARALVNDQPELCTGEEALRTLTTIRGILDQP